MVFHRGMPSVVGSEARARAAATDTQRHVKLKPFRRFCVGVKALALKQKVTMRYIHTFVFRISVRCVIA